MCKYLSFDIIFQKNIYTFIDFTMTNLNFSYFFVKAYNYNSIYTIILISFNLYVMFHFYL